MGRTYVDGNTVRADVSERRPLVRETLVDRRETRGNHRVEVYTLVPGQENENNRTGQ